MGVVGVAAWVGMMLCLWHGELAYWCGRDSGCNGLYNEGAHRDVETCWAFRGMEGR